MAEKLGSQNKIELSKILWTSIYSQLFLGIAGCLIFYFTIPYLTSNVLNISENFRTEAVQSVRVLTLGLPVLMINSAFRGILEGGSRFAIINGIKIPVNLLIFISPLSLFFWDIGLTGIIMILIFSRLISSIIYLYFCLKAFPFLKRERKFEYIWVKRLLKYGGWISVSTVVTPLLLSLDRFLIGSFEKISEVTYYTAPLEMLMRLSIFPGSLMAVLFPAFSALKSKNDIAKTKSYYDHSIKIIFIGMGCLSIGLIFFSDNILKIWLGQEFVEKSSLVFQILSFGILINSLALVPFTFIQGIGHADITAKYHLIELPIYVILIWFLIQNFGIIGAAIAWTTRITLDAFLLYRFSYKYFKRASL